MDLKILKRIQFSTVVPVKHAEDHKLRISSVLNLPHTLRATIQRIMTLTILLMLQYDLLEGKIEPTNYLLSSAFRCFYRFSTKQRKIGNMCSTLLFTNEKILCKCAPNKRRLR